VYQARDRENVRKKERKGNGKKRRSIYRTQSVTFIMLARKSWPNARIFPLGLNL
jgi:hypothetical protein